jgi:hypothetical protein
MTHLSIIYPWKYVRNLKTTERSHARDEAFSISSTSKGVIVVFLQEKLKGYSEFVLRKVSGFADAGRGAGEGGIAKTQGSVQQK